MPKLWGEESRDAGRAGMVTGQPGLRYPRVDGPWIGRVWPGREHKRNDEEIR